MSQKILNNPKFIDEFVSARPAWGPEKARKEAVAMQRAVKHAMAVLDRAPAGETVAFEGSCPSGNTYEGYTPWDGTEECREAIAVKAARMTATQLVRVAERKGSIAAAKMRTMRI